MSLHKDAATVIKSQHWIVMAVAVVASLFMTAFLVMIPVREMIMSIESMQSSLLYDADIKMTLPPNIIFILADDLSWNSINGVEGESDISFVAPGLAELSQQGIRMKNYYAQELCTPSRAALLTGRYPLSMGMQYGTVMATKSWGIPLDEVTIAQVLQETGLYSTHAIGKWHLGHHTKSYLPTSRGFDTFVGYLDGENNYFSKIDPQNTNFRDFIRSDSQCYYSYNKTDLEVYSTNLYRDLAIDIIESHDKEESSLFLYLSFQAVHSPFEDIRGNRIIPKDEIDEVIYDKIQSSVKV